MECLADDVLWAFAQGRLDGEALTAVDNHLDACASCRAIVAGVMRMSNDATGSVADYRDLVAVDPAHYVVGAELAKGGMGRILEAHDRRLGRAVVIKELLHNTGDLRARFEREARITAKLSHPSIVSVLEAGAWPGGEPFYVMKRVSGESLDKAIARGATLRERMGLLANVIAVVDALAYAHARRVIHRDLKPDNVLVGEFGETVVIDWGLAKDLADPTNLPEVAAGPFREAATAGETAHGTVIGTPAYMPPEQARGEAVDERADVYALGALLYHVLAGAPPYAGARSATAVRDAVKAGPPAPLPSDVRRDLATIVAKAMSREAVDRYPTAKELSVELKRFSTGQLVDSHHYSPGELLRRFMRRYRGALGVGAVALATLAVVGVLSVRRIIATQHAAEASRASAEQLVRVMLVDLRHGLEPLGKLDLLGTAAKAAAAYYDGFPAGDSDAEQAQRALALMSVGEVLQPEGDLDGAAKAFRGALVLRAGLMRRAPTDDARALAVADAHRQLGEVATARGDLAGALAEFRSVLELTHDHGDRHHEVDAHLSIGQLLLSQGHADQALAEYRQGIAIASAGQSSHPDDAAWSRVLARADIDLGDLYMAKGDSTAVLTALRDGRTIAERLVARAPSDADAQRTLSVIEQKLGHALFERGELADALVAYRADLALSDGLARRDPTNASWQREAAVSHLNIGHVLEASGDGEGALASYRKILFIMTPLTATDPDNTLWARDLVVANIPIAGLLLQKGDLEGSLTAATTARDTSLRLVGMDPSNTDWQRDLGVGHYLVADVYMEQKRYAAALVGYRASLDIAVALATRDPQSGMWAHDVVVGEGRVGDALFAAGDNDGALASYRASLVHMEALVARDPENAMNQQILVIGHQNIGDILTKKRDAAGALAEYRQSVAIAKASAARAPKDPRWAPMVAELTTIITAMGAKP